jgi:hypothetical protein
MVGEARKMAAELRLLRCQGIDPIEARRTKWRKAEEAKAEAEAGRDLHRETLTLGSKSEKTRHAAAKS